MSSGISFRGAGLGLRRGMFKELANSPDALNRIDFFEVAPENWIGLGGRVGRAFRRYAEQKPVIAHGLSLSLGGPGRLDTDFLAQVRDFLREHQMALYSEHLSWCADEAHLYDLLPIPFTDDAVRHVAARIRQTQDIIGARMAIENASFYTPLAAQMNELDFILAVLKEADCDLLLDVNNVYVNSVNHRYDPRRFIDAIPAERVRYLHIAGHYVEAPDLIVDTHGAAIVDPVFELLRYTRAQIGERPVLLERDFNLPPLSVLLDELGRVREYAGL
jgi:hypothetical protein